MVVEILMIESFVNVLWGSKQKRALNTSTEYYATIQKQHNKSSHNNPLNWSLACSTSFI